MNNRRLLKRLLLIGTFFAILTSFFFGANSVSAQDGDGAQREVQEETQRRESGLALVAKVDGLLDDIVADFIEDSIKTSQKERALVLVLQVDSKNLIISKARLAKLKSAITNSSVPVASWIGPSGAKVSGDVAELVQLTNPIGISPGASIQIGGKQISHNQATQAGFIQTPTLGDLIIQIDSFETKEVKDDETCVGPDCLVHLQPVSKVRFTRLSFLDQTLHTIASPPMAYLLFSLGLGLIILEYYTAGIGISGVIGAASFLFGTYGLVVLPTNLWAVILLLFGIFGYTIDIQTGVPRLWTVLGTISFTLGSIFLYTSGVDLSWLMLLIGTASMLGGMAFALPVLIRSRFTTPTIGREWMIDQTGFVVEPLNPNGTIEIQKALWKAHTFRSTPIPTGTEIKITGLDNLILEVEPQEMEALDKDNKK